MTYYKTGELGEFITLKRGYDLPQQNRKNVVFLFFLHQESVERMMQQWSKLPA